jgi:hypothetical protein
MAARESQRVDYGNADTRCQYLAGQRNDVIAATTPLSTALAKVEKLSLAARERRGALQWLLWGVGLPSKHRGRAQAAPKKNRALTQYVLYDTIYVVTQQKKDPQ